MLRALIYDVLAAHRPSAVCAAGRTGALPSAAAMMMRCVLLQVMLACLWSGLYFNEQPSDHLL
jgi:hypothetical protein